MDWNNYEFDNEPLPPESGRWGKRIRLLLIFVVIAGVTAGLIYYLRPQSSAAPQEPDSPPPTESPADPAWPAGSGNTPEETADSPAGEQPLPGTGELEIIDKRPGGETLPEVPATEEEAPVETPLNPATPPPREPFRRPSSRKRENRGSTTRRRMLRRWCPTPRRWTRAPRARHSARRSTPGSSPKRSLWRSSSSPIPP
ncbi:MAG: hypothetical protein L6W00_10435 [Lentisphaeria bacterium]|nr:MAG: hypothetical protein L6W00_10435 [Lentisphaeria bacterium]